MTNSLEKEVRILRQKETDLMDEITQLKTDLHHYKDKYERVVQAFLQAQRDRFGKKSERFVDDSAEQQPLFESSVNSSEENAKTSETEDITYTRRKPGTRKPDLSMIPTRVIVIPVSEDERVCTCGCQKEVIGYETAQRLNYQPAIFEVLIEKREKRACRKGCDGSVVTAALVPRLVPKCKATESLLAYIAVSKVLDRQPLYHLEKSIEQRYHWRIPRQTMARWLILASEKVQPLINLMKERVLEYDIAAIDATTLQVLNEPQRAPETNSYAYCIRGGPPGKEVILYEYNAYSQKNYVQETLMDFEGTIQCDASPVFNGIGSQTTVTLSYCHAHARRKFEQILKSDKKGKHPIAKDAMRFYKALYAVEREASDSHMTPEQRLSLRSLKSKPILEAFFTWLKESESKTLPKSPIGKAIAYVLSHWDGLHVYLSDGRLEIDNNATERDIKPFVIARKNFLFACTMAGADALGVHFSLILTARQHGLNPLDYMKTIFEKIPLCKTLDDFEALLPWNFSPSTV